MMHFPSMHSEYVRCRLLLGSNPPAVLVGALLTISQLARLHRDNYPPLAEAEPYSQLQKLLTHPEPAVRARVCNLLGNMCRHSAYFYSALDKHGLLPPLIQRCNDSDRSTRKFACFAIGNAGQQIIMSPWTSNLNTHHQKLAKPGKPCRILRLLTFCCYAPLSHSMLAKAQSSTC